MKKQSSIYKTYQSYFFGNIVLPIFLVFIIAVSLVYHYSQKDIREKMHMTESQTIESLENELYNYSMQLSQLINANHAQFLKGMGHYFKTKDLLKYEIENDIKKIYNTSILPSEKLLGVHFYGDDNQLYWMKEGDTASIHQMRNSKLYSKALAHKDRIVVGAVDRADVSSSAVFNHDEKVLAFAIAPSQYNVYGNVEMIILYASSSTFQSIDAADAWLSGCNVYIFDEMNQLIKKSDEQYVKKAMDVASSDTYANTNVMANVHEMSNSGWKVVTISTNTQISGTFRIILLLLFVVITIIGALLYSYTNRLLKNIIEPINQVSNTMRSIKDCGHFQKTEYHGIDEIEVISRTYNEMIMTIQDLMEDNIQKEREKVKEEILTLEYQLNPHFLLNTINTIQFMAKMAKFSSIEHMAESLSKIVDRSFRYKDSFQPLKKELEILDAYIYIMEIRYANNFEVEYEICETCKDRMIPKLILQPFIENAIVHGFKGKQTIGKIKISVNQEEQFLHFVIEDNGIGITHQRINELLAKEAGNGKSIGIANINKRLKLYYGNDSSLNIESNPEQGTTVSFKIPIQSQHF